MHFYLLTNHSQFDDNILSITNNNICWSQNVAKYSFVLDQQLSSNLIVVMSSSDTTNETITLDTNSVSLAELFTDIVTKAHVRQIGHLLVTRTAAAGDEDAEISNQTLFGFPDDNVCTAVLPEPNDNAFSDRKRAYRRQEELRTCMITAVLAQLKTRFEFVYHDALDACGGAKRIFTLTLPQLMDVILREIDNSADAREQQLKDLISAATLDTDQDFPFRHYSTRVTT